MSDSLKGKVVLITGAARRMGRIFALALAPNVIVNGLALGAILPPSGAKANPDILKKVPLQRWAQQNEVEEALLFLLTSQVKPFTWMVEGVWFE